jgi:hypothetical protein
MGTSGAYGGSGGRAWSQARDAAKELLNSPASTESQESALGDLANALDWDRTESAEPVRPTDRPEDGTQAPTTPPPRPPQPFGQLTRPRAGRGDGPGSGGGGGGQRSGGAGSRGGGGRSRRRAASVGGAVLAAGLAVRQGDGATLEALGLSMVELGELSPLGQCNRILKALVGSGSDIDENEILSASSTALVAILTQEAGPEQAVRLFIIEYVMEITVTELGAVLRSDGGGEVSVQVEDELRSLIGARVDQLELDGDDLGSDRLQDAVYQALGSVREVLEAMNE